MFEGGNPSLNTARECLQVAGFNQRQYGERMSTANSKVK